MYIFYRFQGDSYVRKLEDITLMMGGEFIVILPDGSQLEVDDWRITNNPDTLEDLLCTAFE